MVHFPRNRLQVFVSSTYSDLKVERQAAVEAILTAGHIPAGMELFTAGNESQMDVIKQWIDESDVFLLILGGRYGSIEPKTGKSYIHLEYEYAFEKKKTLFACVISEETRKTRVQAMGEDAIEIANTQKLKDFREDVLTKIAEFWSDTKDIQLTIVKKLNELSRRDDLIGWVRADQQFTTPKVAEEIARLSEENAELKSRLQATKESSTNKSGPWPIIRYHLIKGGYLKTLYEHRTDLKKQMLHRRDLEKSGIDSRGIYMLEDYGFLSMVDKDVWYLTVDGRNLFDVLDIEGIESEEVSQSQ